MKNNILINCHSSIKIVTDKIIYIDPYKIKEESNDADLIFITHNHYDHYDEKSILKIKNNLTKIIVTKDLYTKVASLFNNDNIIVVEPNNEYDVDSIHFSTIPSYNVNKKFHPKTNNWVGYILEINDETIYIAGDTDITEENKKISCDIALVPIGGTYTMTKEEAAELINTIKPKTVIPTHYACLVGSISDAADFKKLINQNIECLFKIK